MKLTKTKTYWARIYVAVPQSWCTSEQRILPDMDAADKICQDYVDGVGLCVTVTPTRFLYTRGCESGVIVGLINYPRFPSDPDKIRKRAIELATILKKELHQNRVTIEFPDETVMLGRVK